MTDQPTTDDLLFPLLVEASNEADLDINDKDIRDGHYRITPFASLARKAFDLGARLAAEELGAYPLRFVGTGPDGQVVTGLASDELDRLKAELAAATDLAETHKVTADVMTQSLKRVKGELKVALAQRDKAIADLEEASAVIILASRVVEAEHPAWVILDDYDGSRDSCREVEALGFTRSGDGSWLTAPLPPLDATEVREHPGAGQPMTGVEHPADGTWSPELSSEQDGAAA